MQVTGMVDSGVVRGCLGWVCPRVGNGRAWREARWEATVMQSSHKATWKARVILKEWK